MTSIVGGDFNSWSMNETVMQHLLRHFPDSPSWDGKPTRGRFPTDHLLLRIADDEIHLRSYRRIDNTYYSDHYPRIAWLTKG